MLTRIVENPAKYSLASSGTVRTNALNSIRSISGQQSQHQSIATQRLFRHQTNSGSYTHFRLCPLLHDRPYHHVSSLSVFPKNRLQSFGFSLVSHRTLISFRFPTVVTGADVTGITIINNAFTGWSSTRNTHFFESVPGTQKLLEMVKEEARSLVPNVIKKCLASMNILDKGASSKSGRGGNGGGSNGGNNGAAAAMAAALAATLAYDEDDDDSNSRPQSTKQMGKHTISAKDEQLMMLTKKLIEIRSILLSVDHNETLKLPSIVVIGSQSSGKSSVLEAIVGHEFLPKGTNMVTRRPIELTLVHTPGKDEEYGEFPQLGLGKMHNFKKIQKTLLDMNMGVSEAECVSDEPIELRIYSPNVPDLTLIDLPGYIQISNSNQPEMLKTKIEELCEKYIQQPNIILAVCAANVDLANSPALRASRQHDPLGLRTIGVITKMDLVPPEIGTAILQNGDYPLRLGYIGVVCKSPKSRDGSNMTSTLIENEAIYFQQHKYTYGQNDILVGTGTLRKTLMNVLEQSMGRSLYSILEAVQRELEETRYQFKVQYNDRRVTAESYVAETMDSLKHNFKDFSKRFGKPQVRQEVRNMLEQRVLDICAEHYWTDGKIADINKTSSSEDVYYWLCKMDLAAAALTKSGVGRSTTHLVVDILMGNMERLANADQFYYHPGTRKQIMSFTSEILRTKFTATSDQVENTIKPYKYEVEITDSEWTDGVKRSVVLLEKELELCDEMTNTIKNSIDKSKLKSAIRHVLDNDKEDNHQERIQHLAQDGHGSSDDDEVKSLYNPRLLEKAKQILFLRDRAIILKYRIAALKSRQCKSSDNKQYCPEAFLNIVAEKLTYTAVMFIQVELLNEFFFQFPREVDDRLVYQMDRKQIQQFAKENPPIQEHLSLLERKAKLEDVMDKLNYLVKRQADRYDDQPKSRYT